MSTRRKPAGKAPATKKPARAKATASRSAKITADRSAPAAPAPRRDSRLFATDVALSRADDALALIARDGVRARVERRLSPGVIEHLASDREQLDTARTSREIALTVQKSATGAAHDAADVAGKWLSATRRSARLRGAPPDVRKALGVGSHVSGVVSRAKLSAALQTALDALAAPATRAQLGLLPDDLVAAQALLAQLATTGGAKASKVAARKSTSVDRASVQASLEAGLREVSAAGTQEFWHPEERALHDAFAALLHGAAGEKHADTAPTAPAPAPAKSATAS